MSLLDDVLGQVVADQPPMRGLSGGLIEIRKSTPLGLHALTSKSADPDQQTNEEAIPAPPEPLIHELTTNEATLLIERHIEFFSVDKSGAIRTVRLGSVFVSTYKCSASFKAAGRRGCVDIPVRLTGLGRSYRGRWP